MVDGLVKIAGPMTVLLRDAMREVLEGWREDLDPRWRGIASDAELGFDRIDPALALEPWEPIFPARKGKHYPGRRAALIFSTPSIASSRTGCELWCWDRTPIRAAPSRPAGRSRQATSLLA